MKPVFQCLGVFLSFRQGFQYLALTICACTRCRKGFCLSLTRATPIKPGPGGTGMVPARAKPVPTRGRPSFCYFVCSML